MTRTMLRVSEKDFEHSVIDLAHLLKWRVAHFRPALTSKGWRTPVTADGAGWPDLVLVHPQHGILHRELKTDSGRVSAGQQAWLDAINTAGGSASVWTPSLWPLIEQELMGVAA